MIKYMLRRAREKIVEKEEEKADKIDAGEGDGLSSQTSSDDEDDDKDMGDSSDDDYKDMLEDDHRDMRNQKELAGGLLY